MEKLAVKLGHRSCFSRPKHIYLKFFCLLYEPSMRHLILCLKKIEQNKTAQKKQGSGG